MKCAAGEGNKWNNYFGKSVNTSTDCNSKWIMLAEFTKMSFVFPAPLLSQDPFQRVLAYSM